MISARGVGEEEGVDRSRRQLGQLGRQRLKQVVLVDINLGVNEPLGLSGDGRNDPWVGVTGGVDGNARQAKSRYSSPSVVVTQQPHPLATCRGVTENHTLERCDVCLIPGMLRLRSARGRDAGNFEADPLPCRLTFHRRGLRPSTISSLRASTDDRGQRRKEIIKTVLTLSFLGRGFDSATGRRLLSRNQSGVRFGGLHLQRLRYARFAPHCFSTVASSHIGARETKPGL